MQEDIRQPVLQSVYGSESSRQAVQPARFYKASCSHVHGYAAGDGCRPFKSWHQQLSHAAVLTP